MSKKPLDVFKVIILGDHGVGKTAVMNQLIGGKFSTQYNSESPGEHYLSKDVLVNDRPVCLQIWDTNGVEKFSRLPGSFFKGADCCILVYDVSNSSTFESLDTWHREFLAHIEPKNPDKFPFVVIGNKTDQGREVSHERAVVWCQTKGGHPAIEISAKDSKNIEMAALTVISQCTTHFNEK